MKKILTGSLALMLVTGLAFAQDKEKSKTTETKKECCSSSCKKSKSKKSCCQQPSKAASVAAKGKQKAK